MKVLHLSTADLNGGAAIAAYRLHTGLIQTGIDSQMLVRAKQSDDPAVLPHKTPLAYLSARLEHRPLRHYPNRGRQYFSPQWFPNRVARRVNQLQPDIVHLHWTCGGFLPIEAYSQFKMPMVWTLHDMWAFTGGCHYTEGCDRYLKGCGQCPQLGSDNSDDLSARIWQRKHRHWQQLNLTLVAPSQWLAHCVQDSPLLAQFQTKVVPNGLDTQIFRPYDKAAARDRLALPHDKQLILFGAMSLQDARKGLKHLVAALKAMEYKVNKEEVEIVVFGQADDLKSLPIPYKVHTLGVLTQQQQQIAQAYASADVFVAPSVQDNLPNTILEALACGTPCAAFEIGGMPDMIRPGFNGMLAEPLNAESLADAIAFILRRQQQNSLLSENARATVLETFTLEHQVDQYTDIYESLLTNKPTT